MYYGYDICPKCMEKFIKRKEYKENEEFAIYSGKKCLKCGSKLVLACVGDKEYDDTMYKINLEWVHGRDKNEDLYIETLMKIGNFNINTAVEKLTEKNSLIFEGDLFNTYLSMELLDEVGMGYSVTPKFPFTRFVYHNICLCSKCGNDTIQKIEEMNKLYIKKGIYCENCNDWIMYSCISKLNMDNTIYNLVFSLTKMGSVNKEKILDIIDNLSNKKVSQDKIVICDKANIIYEILQRLELYKVNYEIMPPFPYEVCKIEELNQDLLNEILNSQVD